MTNKTKAPVLADVIKSKDGEDTGNVISQTELDTLKADAEAKNEAEQKVADLEKAQKDMAAQLADLQKAKDEADTLLADIEKAKTAAKLLEVTDVVKGFNLFEEDQVEDVAKFVVANEGDETTAVILATLEKARAAIQAFGETEHGSDLEGVQVTSDEALADVVKDIIKNRKSK